MKSWSKTIDLPGCRKPLYGKKYNPLVPFFEFAVLNIKNGIERKLPVPVDNFSLEADFKAYFDR